MRSNVRSGRQEERNCGVTNENLGGKVLPTVLVMQKPKVSDQKFGNRNVLYGSVYCSITVL